MRNIHQIRKYLAMTITVALCAGMLAGCAKSDKSAQDASAGTGMRSRSYMPDLQPGSIRSASDTLVTAMSLVTLCMTP